MNTDIRVVFVSIPREEAKKFARKLVEERLGACVNIIPKMESYYWWDGKVLEDSESLLLIKTTAARFDELQQYIVDRHPYDLPEIVALPITEGLEGYLKWVVEETR